MIVARRARFATDSETIAPMTASDDRRVRDHPVLGQLPDVPEVAFSFDGRPVFGRAGEPIIAALFAAGVRVLRTTEGGEPRGGYCLVGRCGDCRVTVDGRPDVLACQTPVRAGSRVDTQHGLGTWPADDADRPA